VRKSSIRIGRHAQLLAAYGPKGVFSGISNVRICGVEMRSPRLPWFASIRSPEGIELLDWRLEKATSLEDGGTRLAFSASARKNGIMEWMVHEIRNRVVLNGQWPELVETTKESSLELELHPAERQMGKLAATGFSYRFNYSSSEVPIYRILDRGSWEPGGTSKGCQLWFRNATSPSIVKFADSATFHSTEWFLPGIANPNIFQFQPFQTQFQGFTFTACEKGVLVTWATEPAHIRTLIEKPRGHEEIRHLHEHCDDLSDTLSSSPVEVLWIPGAFNEVELANIYEDVGELVRVTLHRKAGFKRERVQAYSGIEEWSNADLQLYREKGLPKLLDAGAKTIYLANQFANNMNTFGVGNMCCTVDWHVAESVGEKALRDFCRDAAAHGAFVEMWGNTALSTLGMASWNPNGSPSPRLKPLPAEGTVAELLRNAKDACIRNQSGALESDHYAPVFVVMNLRDEDVRSFWLKCWGALKSDIGVSGIFLDSSFNMSSDKFHWLWNPSAAGLNGATIDQTALHGKCRPEHEPKPAILSQYKAHLSLMAEMQRLGYHYAGEDIGVFGVSRSGPSAAERAKCLHLWADSLCNFDIPELEAAGFEPDDVFFKALAFRMMWFIWWVPSKDSLSFSAYDVRGEFDVPRPWHIALLKAYGQVESCMLKRRILPNWQGVEYSSPGRKVVWAFEDMDYDFGMPCAVKLLPTGEEMLLKDGKLRLPKLAIGVFSSHV